MKNATNRTVAWAVKFWDRIKRCERRNPLRAGESVIYRDTRGHIHGRVFGIMSVSRGRVLIKGLPDRGHRSIRIIVPKRDVVRASDMVREVQTARVSTEFSIVS